MFPTPDSAFRRIMSKILITCHYSHAYTRDALETQTQVFLSIRGIEPGVACVDGGWWALSGGWLYFMPQQMPDNHSNTDTGDLSPSKPNVELNNSMSGGDPV